jgi:hypothetical protein
MSIDLDFLFEVQLTRFAWRSAMRVPDSIVYIAASKRFMNPIARRGTIVRCRLAESRVSFFIRKISVNSTRTRTAMSLLKHST